MLKVLSEHSHSFKAHRKLEGSILLVLPFKRDMFRLTTLDKGKI